MEHIHTAVGMFNAAEVLHEYFRHYDIGTEDEKARRRSTLIPMVVLYIFGIEVGIKALIEKQGEKPAWIHDLRDLYDKLPKGIQAKIDNRVTESGVKLSTVVDLLTIHRKSFDQWRYVRDSNVGGLAVDPGALAATLRAIIDVHTAEYGTKTRREAPRLGKLEAVPPWVSDAAAQYMKGVGGTDQRDSLKPTDD